MSRHVQAAKTTFQLVLIKPTHYDDDGYPITWLQSHIPSNTLAALYGLGEDCRRRQVLGSDVDIVIKPQDEPNIRIRPASALARNEGRSSSFDLGRGCPFQCSFCTIINVQGRKSRFRSADDLEAIVRENYKQGITSFFITDDNMARNKHWEDFFDRLIELKENEGFEVSLIIQVDTQCH